MSRFESWWSLPYNDSVFAYYKSKYNPIYPEYPFNLAVSSLVNELPPGFQKLAQKGKIALDLLTVLRNIVAYHAWSNTYDLRLRTSLLSAAPQNKRYCDFWEACSCLLVPGPSFEKYLCFALLLYCLNTFSPRRSHLSASHMAFGTPRQLLTQKLPTFNESSEDETECLIWIWLVLIDSWRAVNGAHSEAAAALLLQFAECFPSYCVWAKIEYVLGQFFATDCMVADIRRCWTLWPAPLAFMTDGER